MLQVLAYQLEKTVQNTTRIQESTAGAVGSADSITVDMLVIASRNVNGDRTETINVETQVLAVVTTAATQVTVRTGTKP
jgi:hypothetical protein